MWCVHTTLGCLASAAAPPPPPPAAPRRTPRPEASDAMGKKMCTLPFAKLSLQMSVVEEQAKELGVDAAGSARTLVAEVLKDADKCPG